MMPLTGEAMTRRDFEEILEANGWVDVSIVDVKICDEHPFDPVPASVKYRGDYLCSRCARDLIGALPAIAAARDWPHLRATGQRRLAS